MFNPERLDNLVKNGLSKNLLTKFLSIEEQKYLQSRKSLNIYFSNTYPHEERKRAFLSREEIIDEIDFKIAILEFKYNEKYYSISHRDVLGTLMSFGINRDVIGDIILSSRNFILILDELANVVMHELTMIKNAPIEIEKVTEQDLLTIDIKNYSEQTIIISSYRLDNIISQVANLSRTKASEMTIKQLIKVNGVYKLNGHYICQYDDILSIRGIGRVIIKEELKQTRKNKIILKILKSL